MPKVSIVIPLYNHRKYIGECVRSALGQTYEDIEIIVVDDGSTDGSAEVLREYLGDITLIRQENQGVSKALNTGIKASSGEYISWLSSDDMFMPEKTRVQVEAMESAESSVGVSHSDALIIDENGKEVSRLDVPPPPVELYPVTMFKHGCFVNGTTTLVRRECLDKVGIFNEKFRSDNDADLWLRILRHYSFMHIPQMLVKYRVHPENMTKRREFILRNSDMVHTEALEAWPKEQLFPNSTDYASEYDELTLYLMKRFWPNTAGLSVAKAVSEGGWTAKRRAISILCKSMGRANPATIERFAKPFVTALYRLVSIFRGQGRQ